MKFLKTANKKRPVCLMDLPMELHFLIRDKLLGDPLVEFRQLRMLRLVCRTFYHIWSPLVTSNLVLFQPGTATSIQSLRYLVHHECKKSTYTTITIKDWHHLPTEMERLYCSKWQIKQRIMALLTVVRTKQHITTLPKNLDLPNVRRARLHISQEDQWYTSRKINIVLSLTQLHELVLDISPFADIKYAARCLRPLNGLRKLTLVYASDTPLQFRCLSGFISRNVNLTYLKCSLRHEFLLDFSTLLCDVPIDKPLMLHHVSLRGRCRNFESLVPHVRALSSLNSRSANDWCAAFLGANVFPPTILVGRVDQELAMYLGNHPGVISLTISTKYAAFQNMSLIKSILSQHATTLQYLSLRTEVLYSMVCTTAGEVSFLQWAKTLREIVLVSSARIDDPVVIAREQRIFNVISRLSSSLTVVVKPHQREIFFLCMEFCRNSTDPLVRSLESRLVYEKWS